MPIDRLGIPCGSGAGWSALSKWRSGGERNLTPNTAASHDPSLTLENNFERMVPETSGGHTFWEHVYRYAFACRAAEGKRVLDIACGEGYGAAALQKAGAAQVIGVDISEEVCLHARKKYGVDARAGSAENIPFANSSFDLIVSFETIEHVRNPAAFLDECARVLQPGGRLIVSTPNKIVYSRRGAPPNRYHFSEMTEEEFVAALLSRFRNIRLYTQRPYSAAWWSPRIFASELGPRRPTFARLRRSAQFRFFQRALYDPTNEERISVVEEILSASLSRTSPLNPYAILPRRKWTLERPTYFIAVASR